MSKNDLDLPWDKDEQEFCRGYEKGAAPKDRPPDFEYYFEFLSNFDPPPVSDRERRRAGRQFTLYDDDAGS